MTLESTRCRSTQGGSVLPRRTLVPTAAAASVATILLVLGAALLPLPAEAQCQISRPPVQISAAGGGTNPVWGVAATTLALFPAAQPKNLLVRYNYGAAVYDVTSPSSPVLSSKIDFWLSPYGYAPPADGQSTTGAIVASQDGQRLAFSMNNASDHINTSNPRPGTQIQMPGSPGWTGAGQAGAQWSSPPNGELMIDSSGGRYILFDFGPNPTVTDITTPVGLKVFYTGTQAFPYQRGFGMKVISLGTSRWLVWHYYTAVYVLDISSPGPAGNVVSGYQNLSVGRGSILGLSGTEQIQGFAAAKGPDGKIYFYLDIAPYGGAPSGRSLVSFDGASWALVGRTAPPVGTTSVPGGPVAVSLGGDLAFFSWAAKGGLYQLSSYTVNTWPTDQSTAVAGLDPLTVGNGGFSPGAGQAFASSASDVAMFYGAGSGGAWTMGVSCTLGAQPSVPSVTVEPVPCPGGAASCPLSGGSQVFLGQKLKVTFGAYPAQTPLTAWSADLDYHAGSAADDAGAEPRIKQPDLGSTLPGGTLALPAPFTFYGPCDPANGGDYATGGAQGPASCWGSVTTNLSQGGRDFTVDPGTGAVTPASKPLSIALYTANQYGSGQTTQFSLNWVVPGVRLASEQMLLGGSVVDGSDGTPVTRRWSFGATSGSLTEATACANLATCSPGALVGSGTSAYRLDVTYAGGYGASKSGTLNVTELVLGFSHPAGVTTGSTVAVSKSALFQQAPSVTGLALAYSLCATSDAACNAAVPSTPASNWNGTTFSFTAPSTPGNYLLRVRATYSVTGGASGKTQDWLTNGSALSVSDVMIDAIVLKEASSGISPCGAPGQLSCPGSGIPLTGGTAYRAYAYSGGAELTGVSIAWAFPGANPTSGTGQGAIVTYPVPTAAGAKYTLTVSGVGSPKTQDVTVSAPSSGGGGGGGGGGTGGGGGGTGGGGTGQTGTCTIGNLSLSAGSQSGLAVTFTSSCPPSDYCSWTFGDGGSIAGYGRSSATYTYAAAGTYAVRVMDYASQFSAYSGDGCINVTVTGTGGGTGGGGTGGGGTGGGGTGTGLISTTCGLYFETSRSDNAPLTPTGSTFTITQPYGAIFRAYANLQGAGYTGGLTWSLSNGWTSTTNPSATVTPGPGTYSVNLSADGGCSGTATLVVLAGQALDCTKAGIALSGTNVAGSGASYTAPSGAAVVLSAYSVVSSSTPAASVAWTLTPSGTGQVRTTSGAQATVTGLADGTWTVSADLGSGCVKTATLVVGVAPISQWTLPGVVYIDGRSAGGAFWKSDVWIVNPGAAAATLRVSYLPADGFAGADAAHSFLDVAVPAGGTATLPSVLYEKFALQSGFGALLFKQMTSGATTPVVSGRTYNAADPNGGTYGLALSAVAVPQGVAPRSTSGLATDSPAGTGAFASPDACPTIPLGVTSVPGNADIALSSGVYPVTTGSQVQLWAYVNNSGTLAASGDVSWDLGGATSTNNPWTPPAFGAAGDVTLTMNVPSIGCYKTATFRVSQATGPSCSTFSLAVAQSGSTLTPSGGSYPVTVGSTLTFTAAGYTAGSTLTWTSSGGQSLSGNPATATFSTAGTYTVTSYATSSQGTCTQTVTIVVTSAGGGGGTGSGGSLPTPKLGDNILVGLRENAQYRTNLALVNLGADAAQVRLTFRDPAGKQLGSPVTVSLVAGGIKQVNSILSAGVDKGGAGYAAGADWFNATVEVLSGSAVYPYASINDNVTNDPVVVIPAPRLSPRLRLGGVVRTPGANNAQWRTDIVLYNPSTVTRKADVTLSYVTSAFPNARQTYGFPVEIGAGVSLASQDLIGSILPLSPDANGNLPAVLYSYMDVAPSPDDPLPTQPFLVSGKTYTPLSGGGTMGTLIVPVTEADAIVAGGTNKRLVLAGIVESADRSVGKRTDVAVFRASTTGSGATATIRILDASGKEVANKAIAFGAETITSAFQQFNVKAILDANAYAGDYSQFSIVIDTVTGTTPVAAYATTVDNKTGDNSFVVGVPVP